MHYCIFLMYLLSVYIYIYIYNGILVGCSQVSVNGGVTVPPFRLLKYIK